MAVTNIKTVVEATVAPQIIALELKYKSAIDEARSIVEKQNKIIANNATIAGDTQLAVNKISEEVKKELADMSSRLETIEANIATLRADVDKLIAAN